MTQGLAPDGVSAAAEQPPRAGQSVPTSGCCIPPETVPALRLLLRAADYAADAGGAPWQFAVELRDLQVAGLTRHDLRWLLAKGFAQHAQEITTPGDGTRSFRPLAPTAAPPGTCVLLTATGAQALRPWLALAAALPLGSRPQSGGLAPRDEDVCPPLPPGESRGEGSSARRHDPGSPHIHPITPQSHPHVSPNAPPLQDPKPEWDCNRRELRFRGQVVKRYRVPAPNQELILTAFQEEGWPEFIDDPLVPDYQHDPKRRLQATIKSLNRHHLTPLLRFHGNGNGCRIHWSST